jgi:hypothetical protein
LWFPRLAPGGPVVAGAALLSADGTQFAFTAPAGGGTIGIYRAPLDGGATLVLKRAGLVLDGASADLKTIFYSRQLLVATRPVPIDGRFNSFSTTALGVQVGTNNPHLIDQGSMSEDGDGTCTGPTIDLGWTDPVAPQISADGLTVTWDNATTADGDYEQWVVRGASGQRAELPQTGGESQTGETVFALGQTHDLFAWSQFVRSVSNGGTPPPPPLPQISSVSDPSFSAGAAGQRDLRFADSDRLLFWSNNYAYVTQLANRSHAPASVGPIHFTSAEPVDQATAVSQVSWEQCPTPTPTPTPRPTLTTTRTPTPTPASPTETPTPGPTHAAL